MRSTAWEADESPDAPPWPATMEPMDATDAVEALDGDLPAEIERVLADYFAGRAERARQIGADFASALDALRAFVLGGGKRIRPTFAWWGWRGAGGDPGGPDTPSVLRAISALELLQACALVHDDLMDA